MLPLFISSFECISCEIVDSTHCRERERVLEMAVNSKIYEIDVINLAINLVIKMV